MFYALDNKVVIDRGKFALGKPSSLLQCPSFYLPTRTTAGNTISFAIVDATMIVVARPDA